jgi:DNA-binding MarR family transcriptional regulator
MESHDASQLELAQRMGMSPAQISGLVEVLRQRALLVSERSPRDRRRQTWRLTAAGEKVLIALDTQLEARAVACRDPISGITLGEMSLSIQGIEAFLGKLSDATAIAPLDADSSRRGAAA